MQIPEYLEHLGIDLDWPQVIATLERTLEDFPLFELRKKELFLQFLPVGYTYVTLTCIDPELFFELLINKTKIGMLITLYDDLADNPKRKNSKLLKCFYYLWLHSFLQTL